MYPARTSRGPPGDLPGTRWEPGPAPAAPRAGTRRGTGRAKPGIHGRGPAGAGSIPALTCQDAARFPAGASQVPRGSPQCGNAPPVRPGMAVPERGQAAAGISRDRRLRPCGNLTERGGPRGGCPQRTYRPVPGGSPGSCQRYAARAAVRGCCHLPQRERHCGDARLRDAGQLGGPDDNRAGRHATCGDRAKLSSPAGDLVIWTPADQQPLSAEVVIPSAASGALVMPSCEMASGRRPG